MMIAYALYSSNKVNKNHLLYTTIWKFFINLLPNSPNFSSLTLISDLMVL